MRRFLVAALPESGRATVDEVAAHHLLNVLRLVPGDRVVLFDGHGREALGELIAVSEGLPVLQVVGPPRHAAPEHPLHLLFALTKGPAMDAAVRMATEAGATHLHPVLSARSVARGDRGERWARIARSAAQQCGRADVPEVLSMQPLDIAVGELPAGLDRRVALPGAVAMGPADGAAAVLIGPEGGLTDGEVRAVLDAGFSAMGLGRWVLRAETAAAVAVALVAPR